MVSVVIATKDRPELFNRCVRSVLDQSYRDIEVLVINDGSSKENSKKYEKCIYDLKNEYVVNINYFDNIYNKGLSFSRNIGIRNASGELVYFLDDDAIVDKDTLFSYKKFFDEENIVAACGKILPIKGEKYYYIPENYNKGDQKVVGLDWMQEGNSIFKKEILDEVGGYDDNIKFAHEGRDLYKRILAKGYKFAYIPQGLIYHTPPNPMKLYSNCKREFIFGEKNAYLNKKNNRNLWGLFFGKKADKKLFSLFYIFLLANIVLVIYLASTNIAFCMGLIVTDLIILILSSYMIQRYFKAKNIIAGLALLISRLCNKTGTIVGVFKYKFNKKI